MGHPKKLNTPKRKKETYDIEEYCEDYVKIRAFSSNTEITFFLNKISVANIKAQ